MSGAVLPVSEVMKAKFTTIAGALAILACAARSDLSKACSSEVPLPGRWIW